MKDEKFTVHLKDSDPYLVEESAQKEDFYIYLAREKTVFSNWSSMVTEFPHYRLYYVADAVDAQIVLKNETVTLQKGWIYYIPANMIVGGSCQKLSHIFIHFLPNPEVKSLLSKCENVCAFEATPKDIDLFRSVMNHSLSTDISSDFIINGAMYLLLGKILSLCKNIDNDEKSKFNVVIDYIDKHIAEKFDLNKIASLMHYNTAYFAHKFKDAFGISPIQYINDKKIALACKLLAHPDISMQKISETLGFSSEYYFSRLFNKKTGKSPTEYKNYLQKQKCKSTKK